jgi:FtsP/CotA-like multicopper oxidase with cupredoxin domain
MEAPIEHRRRIRALRLGLVVAATAAVALSLVALSAGGPDRSRGARAGAGTTHVYYVAADEVAWDYAPLGRNGITGEPFDEDANVFVGQGFTRIGKVYLKSLYREYTDATFTALKPVPPAWQHLGALGPVLRAEVGDTIEVVFKNNSRFPASMHPHGVFYDKDSEGAGYNDGTSGNDKGDDSVAPGQTWTYHWKVPERAGPGPHDPSSILWMYHSHVDEPADTNSGLIGPIIVSARGTTKADGTPADVDREFVTMFTVFDENSSLYLADNIAKYAGKPKKVDPDDEGFVESNLMHSVNGYVFGNLPGLKMRVGERVRWYTMGMGTEVDMHTPHWHGQTVLANGMRTDVVELLPMSMKVADMVPDNPGTWFFHCHVNDHISAGMLATFTVDR